ncbi:glycosyltransferase family 39 protein [Candidatus Woesearchaeota archaeon]|nr:glycosyltransferase family 39 protein [Candidatus Woesearchaeota archaeon]
MKLNKNYIQTSIFIALYLFAIYFWTQPLQERKLPYGEYDAMSHFEVADYMAYNDRSFMKLPDYIDLRYGLDNKYKPHTLWYPPPFHASLGVAETIGGERIVPVFLLNTVMSTFIMISVYFVINSLFGFLPAILSSLLLVFSPRDFMPYLWGQWPERFAYALVPIILYCFYMYFTSFSKEDKKPIYLYMAALFLGINILIHPLVFFHSAAGLALLYIFLSIKQKKLVFEWKHIAVSAMIFLALFLLFPYQTFNIFPKFTGSEETGEANPFDLSRLFQWSLNPADYAGSVPPSYFSFRDMHGLWTLPLLLAGILFLAWRREERDLLLMAWLASLYIVLHRDLIGQASFLHRSLSASAHIFAPLAAIGAVYLASIIKLPSNLNKYLKYGIAAAFVFLVISVNMAYASKLLNKDTYNDFFGTLNREEFEAAEWILQNVPSSANVTVLGIPHEPDKVLSVTSKKIRWLAAASQHVSRFYYLREDQEQILKSKDWYIMIDYTMLGPLNDRQTFEKMQKFEKESLIKHKLVYDKNSIKVYNLED